MPKIRITIDRDVHGTFWTRATGKHEAFREYADALARANTMRGELGGSDKAEILDLSGGPQDAA